MTIKFSFSCLTLRDKELDDGENGSDVRMVGVLGVCYVVFLVLLLSGGRHRHHHSFIISRRKR